MGFLGSGQSFRASGSGFRVAKCEAKPAHAAKGLRDAGAWGLGFRVRVLWLGFMSTVFWPLVMACNEECTIRVRGCKRERERDVQTNCSRTVEG